MLIVSDTSPITNLIQIKQLDLLEQLFEKVILPEKVFMELCVYEAHKEEIENRSWLVVKTVQNKTAVKELEEYLDAGEAEALVLAKELNADLLIIDERKGRKTAEKYGLRIIGLLGVLVTGKRKGYLEKLKPILDELIKEIGFRVSEKLYKRVLEEVGE